MLLLLACTTYAPDTGGPAPLPPLTVPCGAGQTLTLPRYGAALESLALCPSEGPCGYAWGWLSGEGLTVECGVGGVVEVQWTM